MTLKDTNLGVDIEMKHQQYVNAQTLANDLFRRAEEKNSINLEMFAQSHQNEADRLWEELDEMGAF